MLSSSFVAYFFLLSVWSSLGLDRTDRLLINSDPQALQVQINHLIQELGKTNQEVSYLKSQLSSQHHQISSCAGSTFTVWGKQSCPKVNGTELVYNGFTSGSQYNEKGNGVNTLCLPHDPENLLTSISVSTGNDYAHLYGAEYQFNIGRIQIDDNVPCAVCQTKRASSTIMIPGIERTGRLFVDNGPHGLQVQVDHLLQELNALKSDFNREISYLKSQLATQGQEISTCRGSTYMVWGEKSCPAFNGTEQDDSGNK
uniref:Uncharacterized protein n=1 Tax=Magallana gigas TaxID=29159 RepID=A0A8W8LQ93_MAGGI